MGCRGGVAGSASGVYVALGELPSACGGKPTTSKKPWSQTDIKNANTIDWVIEGNTYGCYTVSVGNAPTGCTAGSAVGNCGASLAVAAISDIDGNGENACVYLYKPLLDSNAAPVSGTPSACGATVAPPYGQAVAFTADNVF